MSSSNRCVLIADVIYCQCGDPSSHYGTMGERGAREVRCEAPPKEHRPSNQQLCGECNLPIHPGDPVRHCGTHITHQYTRCIALLRLQIDGLRRERDTLAQAGGAAFRELHAKCSADEPPEFGVEPNPMPSGETFDVNPAPHAAAPAVPSGRVGFVSTSAPNARPCGCAGTQFCKECY